MFYKIYFWRTGGCPMLGWGWIRRACRSWSRTGWCNSHHTSCSKQRRWSTWPGVRCSCCNMVARARWRRTPRLPCAWCGRRKGAGLRLWGRGSLVFPAQWLGPSLPWRRSLSSRAWSRRHCYTCATVLRKMASCKYSRYAPTIIAICIYINIYTYIYIYIHTYTHTRAWCPWRRVGYRRWKGSQSQVVASHGQGAGR